MKLRAGLSHTDCCGLIEVSGLDDESNPYLQEVSKRSLGRGTAYFATTVARQKDQIKKLKKLKFRPVGSWRNKRTSNKITLWVRNVVPTRKKRK